MNAEQQYVATIEALREKCKALNSKGDLSTAAFCEKHQINRSNLTEILNEKQDISIALFLKLAAVLKDQEPPQLPEGLERWSLRTWLAVDSFQVQQAMYSVNLG